MLEQRLVGFDDAVLQRLMQLLVPVSVLMPRHIQEIIGRMRHSHK